MKNQKELKSKNFRAGCLKKVTKNFEYISFLSFIPLTERQSFCRLLKKNQVFYFSFSINFFLINLNKTSEVILMTLKKELIASPPLILPNPFKLSFTSSIETVVTTTETLFLIKRNYRKLDDRIRVFFQPFPNFFL